MAEKLSLAKLREATRSRDDEDAEFEWGERAAEAPTTNTRTAVSASSPVEAPQVAARKPASGDRVYTSIYLPCDLWRRLRAIAAAEDCKVHDLIMEGLATVISRRAA